MNRALSVVLASMLAMPAFLVAQDAPLPPSPWGIMFGPVHRIVQHRRCVRRDLDHKPIRAEHRREFRLQDFQRNFALVLEILGEEDRRYAPPRASMSARSFVRPEARLLRMKAARPMNGTRTSPKESSTRSFHASSNSTPLMPVSRSNSVGRQPELDDRVGSREIGLADSDRIQRCPESREGRPDPTRVGYGRVDPDVEVDRRARHAVDRQRVRADDEKPGVGLNHRGEEIAEVLDHAPLPSIRLRSRRHDRDGHRPAGVGRQRPARERPRRFTQFADEDHALGGRSTHAAIVCLTASQRHHASGHVTTCGGHGGNLPLQGAPANRETIICRDRTRVHSPYLSAVITLAARSGCVRP